ncbi:MAG: hypothetical protein ABJA18_07720 [bacterium]
MERPTRYRGVVLTSCHYADAKLNCITTPSLLSSPIPDISVKLCFIGGTHAYRCF